VGLDLDFDDAQAAIGAAVEAFCADRCTDETVKQSAGRFPAELWRELADLGMLGLASPEGEGGALELAAALEVLGRALFPGPLAATFFATQVLPEKERGAVIAGEKIAALSAGPLVPFAPVAQLFVVVAEGRAVLARPRGAVEPVATLGGEPWGRVELEPERDLCDARAALALHDTVIAVYLAAAGARLVSDASEHARTRTQFGRTIGEFQAVAHPLADCHLRLDAAAGLARSAAFCCDAGRADAGERATTARLSAAAAARHTAYTAHQVFGALGITTEGPVFHVSRRIEQLAAQPPAPQHELLLEPLGL
jgi:hypothetical protein